MKSTKLKNEMKISWIYPERGTARQRLAEDNAIWETYRRITGELGLNMTLNKPDDITISVVDKKTIIYLKDEVVTPENTIFVTSIWSLPHQQQDVCNQVYLYEILEMAGFYLPIPPKLTYISTDKLATMHYLKDCPTPCIPTVRIASGRDATAKNYSDALDKLSFPILLKPAYWAMGVGVCLARDIHDLQGIIGLATGADTVMVAQPYLGQGVNDFRVYTVGGIVRAVLRRTPAGAALTANLVNGGSGEYVTLPPELEDAVAFVLKKFPLPYLAIDFLWDGMKFWLSEVELDGALGYAVSKEVADIQYPVLLARFDAYKQGHAQWIGGTRND